MAPVVARRHLDRRDRQTQRSRWTARHPHCTLSSARRSAGGQSGRQLFMRVPPAQIYFPPEDRAAILQQIDECLASGQLTLGKYGRELETQFAASLGVKHAIAVNSGTSAIEI